MKQQFYPMQTGKSVAYVIKVTLCFTLLTVLFFSHKANAQGLVFKNSFLQCSLKQRLHFGFPFPFVLVFKKGSRSVK